jgi:Fe-S cluster assembly protein SufD
MDSALNRVYTEGEKALFAAFDSANLSGDARDEAIAALKQNGLPTRKVEAFHYTDLRSLLRGDFTIAHVPSHEDARKAGAAFPRLVDGAAVLHFRDGHFLDFGEAMPAGISVSTRLPDAATTNDVANALGQLNMAFATGGACITVDANAKVAQTIGIAHTPVATQSLAASRVAIEVGSKTECTFVERGVGPDGNTYLHAPATDLNIAEGASVTYTMVIEEGADARRLGRLSVWLAKDAKLKLNVIAFGGKLVRQELNFVVQGEGVELEIAGINLIGEENHIDITSRIDHQVPDTTSTELFRNVVTQRGRGVFQGQIKVAQPAQHTDARMACNTLLLSDDCDFSAKPELEIFADDVQCAHGATVADIEDSHLFYLRARGLKEDAARRLLVKAFVGEVLDEMEDEALAETLSGRIDAWMERHV